jgi:hypothetical protein
LAKSWDFIIFAKIIFGFSQIETIQKLTYKSYEKDHIDDCRNASGLG